MRLRDHAMTGDAIRIQLPHIDWGTLGDIKNQYLWLENHQHLSEFDQNAVSCTDWSTGIHAFIQVGKDITISNTQDDVYPGYSSSDYSKPNALGSYLFPMTAEGRYDDIVDLSEIQPGPGWEEYCIASIQTVAPIDQLNSEENPFTGHSDLFREHDTDLDGELRSTDDVDFTKGKYDALGNIVWQPHDLGDEHDAFRLPSGETYPHTILSLGGC